MCSRLFEALQKVIRSSKRGFVKKTLVDHKGLVREIKHLLLVLSSTCTPTVTIWEK